VLEVKFIGAHYRLLIRTSEMELIAYAETDPGTNAMVQVYAKGH